MGCLERITVTIVCAANEGQGCIYGRNLRLESCQPPGGMGHSLASRALHWFDEIPGSDYPSLPLELTSFQRPFAIAIKRFNRNP